MRESRVDSGELTDEDLLAGMAVGEQAAAIAFVRRYQRRVFGLAYSMTGDAGVAEDVAQEAMTRVWRHAPVFDPRRGSVTSWVLTITRNLAIDALRMRRAVPTDPTTSLSPCWPATSATRRHGGTARRRADRPGCARACCPTSSAVPSFLLRSTAAPHRDQRVRGHPARHRQDADPDRPHPAARRHRPCRGGERRAMNDAVCAVRG